MASTFLLVVVFVLDLIAFSLAVAAEQRRSSYDIIIIYNRGSCTRQHSKHIVESGSSDAGLALLRSSCLQARTAPNANSYYCVYDSDIATGLGVGSFLFLMVSQLLIMAATRCLCCGRALRPGRSRVWAIVLFISCWVTFLIAEVCLLAGSVRNAYHTKYRTYLSQNPPSCETLRKGVFGAGAAFIIFTGVLSELFYVSYSKTGDGFLPESRDTGIRMGSI